MPSIKAVQVIKLQPLMMTRLTSVLPGTRRAGRVASLRCARSGGLPGRGAVVPTSPSAQWRGQVSSQIALTLHCATHVLGPIAARADFNSSVK